MDQILLGVLSSVAQNLGINMAASALWDGLKQTFVSPTITRPEAEEKLGAYLRLHGVSVSASTVIDALAISGVLSIQGSTLYAPAAITMGAGPGARFQFGNNSSSITSSSRIDAGAGAQVTGSNASVRQNPDGSVVFSVGNSADSGIQISVDSNEPPGGTAFKISTRS
jgi:hypothetical protein